MCALDDEHAAGMFDTHSNLSLQQKTQPPLWVAVFFGGDGEIRTLEELLTLTRFPIVRARPTTRHLRVVQEKSCSLVSLDIVIQLSHKVKEYFTILRKE